MDFNLQRQCRATQLNVIYPKALVDDLAHRCATDARQKIPRYETLEILINVFPPL